MVGVKRLYAENGDNMKQGYIELLGQLKGGGVNYK